jgi:hypothetical protein
MDSTRSPSSLPPDPGPAPGQRTLVVRAELDALLDRLSEHQLVSVLGLLRCVLDVGRPEPPGHARRA